MDALGRFGDEQLIVVDERGTPLGTESKRRCHEGQGLLHQAFSVYLFDGEQRLLTQQRSSHKPLWPGFWSNSGAERVPLSGSLGARTSAS